MPGISPSAGRPLGSSSTYSSSLSKHWSQSSSGSAGPRRAPDRVVADPLAHRLPLDLLYGEASVGEHGAQLEARVVKGLVERIAVRAESLRTRHLAARGPQQQLMQRGDCPPFLP